MLETRAWSTLGDTDPRELEEARLQLHWAAQAVGALANSVLEELPDDSQDSFVWKDDRRAFLSRLLPGGQRAALLPETGELQLLAERGLLWSLPLKNLTLDQAMSKLGEAAEERLELKRPLSLRDYEMPEHPVGDGARFSLDRHHTGELTRWFACGHGALRNATAREVGATEIRCWPHHFDLGSIIVLEPEKDPEEARSIGLGLSPGDGSYGEPYFYVSPYPKPESPPKPAFDGAGHWHDEGFFAAVLTATELLEGAASPGEREAVAGDFLKEAIAACHEMLGVEDEADDDGEDA